MHESKGVLRMVPAGGSVHGRAHPDAAQGCAGWFALPGVPVLGVVVFSQHLKSEAARADRQSWFPDAAKPAMGGARHGREEECSEMEKAGRVLQPPCQI